MFSMTWALFWLYACYRLLNFDGADLLSIICSATLQIL
uniref:Uncharacterized protein n=1 Tax=Arundo donax TaxID=35708 RepID=A0A0A9ETF7_ARUDO